MGNALSVKIGEKNNKLIVTKILDSTYKKYECRFVQVVCECGVIKEIPTHRFKSGLIKSCGCIKVEQTKKALTTHGMTKTRFFTIWSGMLNRCYGKALSSKRYWGRNIKVCTRWKNFSLFRDDMLTAYKKHVLEHGVENTTIDRINNNKGYSIKNCRWATRSEQMRNTSNNHHIVFNKKDLILTDWAKEYGITRELLKNRLKNGWPIEKALTLPKYTRCK